MGTICSAADSPGPVEDEGGLPLLKLPVPGAGEDGYVEDDVVSVEALRWVNRTFEILWPEMDKVAQAIVEHRITPKIQEVAGAKHHSLKDVHFSKFTLGNAHPTISGLTVCKGAHGGSKLRMVVEYNSDMNVQFVAMKMHFGMKSFLLIGEVVVLLRPYLEGFPNKVGGITMYFVNRPRIEMDFTGIANIADIGGISGVVRQAIMDMMAEKMVLPNAITELVGIESLTVYPPVMGSPHPPIGALRINLVSAKGLKDGDWHLNPLATAVDDNYVRFTIGAQVFKAPVRKLPQAHTFSVLDVMQRIFIDVYDEDQWTADDFLGSAGSFTIAEAKALSGVEVKVIDHTSKDQDGGILTMEVEFLSVMCNKLGRDTTFVVLQTQEVTLPSELEGKIIVRGAVGKDERDTPAAKPMGRQSTDLVKSVMEEVRERCKKEGMKDAAVKRVTDLTGLKSVTEGFKLAVNNDLSFPVPTTELKDAALKLSIVQKVSKTETALGSIDLPLGNFAKDPSMLRRDPIEIKSANGTIQVAATLFVSGLEITDVPEEAKLDVKDMTHMHWASTSDVRYQPKGGGNSPCANERSHRWFFPQFKSGKSNGRAESPRERKST
mmetsp:Transcript_37771/g.87740  ORF Transcript_37771/g.87740 Transcript_37771/m.87740 type:complete len:605 (-) Transcript_37771:106-1920(-)|eukprot:CAMPEP_0171057718 /NCGR_PEP_ID=MMETSP0766_2-20121228/2002_1 /TAXON_ID=439317 /ORGANISM="Gambierdiscus australes, Strain CAWD 149" /LENGTH=604 /DNA_ID=CAMNT_0011512897 /DNA_START=87 /DNA_END=1901 /DNA_ORIENTATION=-